MQLGIVRKNAYWLLIPPIALCLLDFGLTLFCQPSAYWAGDHTAVSEISPSYAHALAIHPLVFCGVGLSWICIFSALILLLPESLALTLTVAIVIAHMAGAASWLVYRFHSYQSANLLALMTSGLIVLAFKRGQDRDGRPAFNWDRTGFPGWIRWLLILLIAVLPVWWYIIPH
jgi:hypothetical protein